MNPSLITEKELQRRIDNLPSNLRAISMSESVIEDLRKVCRTHYLDDERTLIMEHIVGLIILGFISLDELNVEISSSLRMNIQHANDIAVEVARKIFAPIKDEIEKNYSPVSAETADLRGQDADLRRSRKEGKKDISIELPIAKEIKLPISADKTQASVDNISVNQRLDQRQSAIERGMPKIIKATEILEQITKSAPTSREPMQPPPKDVTPMPEFMRTPQKDIMLTREPTQTESPRESAIKEGPKIIHKETKFEPTTESKKRSLGGLFGFLAKRKIETKTPEQPVAAKIETFHKNADLRGLDADLRGQKIPITPPIKEKTDSPKISVQSGEVRLPKIESKITKEIIPPIPSVVQPPKIEFKIAEKILPRESATLEKFKIPEIKTPVVMPTREPMRTPRTESKETESPKITISQLGETRSPKVEIPEIKIPSKPFFVGKDVLSPKAEILRLELKPEPKIISGEKEIVSPLPKKQGLFQKFLNVFSQKQKTYNVSMPISESIRIEKKYHGNTIETPLKYDEIKPPVQMSASPPKPQPSKPQNINIPEIIKPSKTEPPSNLPIKA